MTRASTASGRAAVALDNLLRHGAPGDLAAFAALAREMPPATRDQLDAAIIDAHRRLSTAAARTGARVQALPLGRWPEWVTLDVFATVVGWISDEGRTCIHAPHPDRPAPVFAAAWSPGLVVCARCTDLLATVRGSVADRTCDGCGHVCAGPDAGDPIYSATTILGALTYLMGVCTSCRWWPAGADGVLAGPSTTPHPAHPTPAPARHSLAAPAPAPSARHRPPRPRRRTHRRSHR